MALWKPFRGSRATLDAIEKHDGYVYFCTDDGSLFFDYTDSDGNLQRKQINAKDAETLTGKTLDELKAELAVHPDWNQNNETAADYIKNRTHWKEEGLNVIVPATTERSFTTDMYAIDTAIITVDGVRYQCERYLNMYGDFSYGDSRLNDDDDSHPEDVPFNVSYYLTDDMMNSWYITYPDGGTYTIEIAELTGDTIYHTLDESYIPETIARKAFVEEALTQIPDVSNYYTKPEIDALELITVEEIDDICNASIEFATLDNEVSF